MYYGFGVFMSGAKVGGLWCGELKTHLLFTCFIQFQMHTLSGQEQFGINTVGLQHT